MTPGEVLVVLTRAGFVVLGTRPLESVRKCLEREASGVYSRPAAIERLRDNTYAYKSGALKMRTGVRWAMQFPTLS